MRSIFLILLSVAPFASFATAGVIRTYNAWLAELNAELATGPTDAQMRNWTFYNMPFTDPTPMPFTDPTPMPFADPTRTLPATADVIRTYNAWLAEFNAELATGPTDAQMRNWTFYNMPFADPAPTPVLTPTPIPGQVSLAWDLDNDSTVVGYNLYYTTNPTALKEAMRPPIPGTPLKISGRPTTTVTLTGLSSGVVFYFGLTAYNAIGESVLSKVVWTPVP